MDLREGLYVQRAAPLPGERVLMNERQEDRRQKGERRRAKPHAILGGQIQLTARRVNTQPLLQRLQRRLQDPIQLPQTNLRVVDSGGQPHHKAPTHPPGPPDMDQLHREHLQRGPHISALRPIH